MFVGHGKLLHYGCETQQGEFLQQAELTCRLVCDLQRCHGVTESVGYLKAWPSQSVTMKNETFRKILAIILLLWK